MASCCCWFIQPAMAMRTTRKGSRTFVVLACKGYYAPGGRSVRIQIFQRDRISGHNDIACLSFITPDGEQREYWEHQTRSTTFGQHAVGTKRGTGGTAPGVPRFLRQS